MTYTDIYKTRKEKTKYGFFLFLCTTFFSSVVFIINLFRSNIVHDMDWLSWIYYVPAAIGQASLFAGVLFLIFYLPFVFLFKSYKVPVTIYTIFAVILQIVLILDGFVFNLYRFHINGFVIELAFGAGGKENFVFDFKVYLKFAVLILFTAVIPYLLAVFAGKRFSRLLRKKKIVTLSLLLLLCMVFSHAGHAVAVASRQSSIQKSATVLPYFYPLTANNLLDKLGIVDKDEIDNLNYNVTSSDIVYPLRPLITADSIPNYNIILIVIDSWTPRSFDSITTPNMYRMARQNQLFEHHYSSSNGTRGSLFGIFFGLSFTYKAEFEIAKVSPLWIDQLIERNYSIQTFPSTIFSSPPYHEIIFRRVPGINTKTQGKTPFDRDNKITEMSIEYMNNRKPDQPFFSFIFYDLPHAMAIPKEYLKFQPSWTEADYLALHNDLDPEPYFNLYRNCVHHVDGLIGKVLDHVKEKGLMDNTVIIITGDHSQEFNENKKNYWGHSANYSKWQIEVPFIMYYPGIDPGKRFSHLTTHYDIVPTLMNRFFGVENPTVDYSMGFDLYEENPKRYPHVVGDDVNYGFVFEDMIITTNHIGSMIVTDKQMNDLPRKAVNVKDLQEAIDKKNRFYRKNE